MVETKFVEFEFRFIQHITPEQWLPRSIQFTIFNKQRLSINYQYGLPLWWVITNTKVVADLFTTEIQHWGYTGRAERTAARCRAHYPPTTVHRIPLCPPYWNAATATASHLRLSIESTLALFTSGISWNLNCVSSRCELFFAISIPPGLILISSITANEYRLLHWTCT